ncbi:MAG: glycosyltransferase, partial [Cyanobacteria bacterium P01_G01_bin.19]
PDLVLVDKKPSGIKGELDLAIDYLKSNLPATKFVLLLRDILDTPQKTIQEWRRENYYQQVESIYDRLLVVGMPEIFDLCRNYKFDLSIANKMRYCGYIRKESGLRSRQSIRQELDINNQEKLALVTPGGGEDGYYLVSSYLQGLAKHSLRFNQEKVRSLIFCGAEMPAEQQQKIHQQAAKCPGVKVLEFTNDLMSYVNAADVVISMGGYNTITEVLQTGKKAIVVPRIKPGREQLIRAQNMAKAGLIKMIHPEKLKLDLLIDTLFDSLAERESAGEVKGLDFAGLPRVTDYLAMLLFNSFSVREVPDIVLQSA